MDCSLDTERRMSFARYEAEGEALSCDACAGLLRRRLSSPGVAFTGRWYERIERSGEEQVYRDELRSSTT